MIFSFFKPKTTYKSITNFIGIAKTDIKPFGKIRIKRKTWKAKAFNNQQINKGDFIKIVDIKNLLLVVKKISKGHLEKLLFFKNNRCTHRA